MSGFSPFELQKSIYQALSEDPVLAASVSGVFDRVPEGAAFPYITVGDTQGRDWSTKSGHGMNLVVTLHVFSRAGGRKEALTLMERMHTLLHEGNLSIDGHVLVMMRFEMSDVLLARDGETYEGVLKFRALTEAA